jgi:hypothetical protein
MQFQNIIIILSTLLITLAHCQTCTGCCYNNGDCFGAASTRCTTNPTGGLGNCVIGLSRGDPCSTNSDCDASSYLVCIRGVCSPDPLGVASLCADNFRAIVKPIVAVQMEVVLRLLLVVDNVR